MNVIFKNIPLGIKKYELAKFIESRFNAKTNIQEGFCIPIGDIDIMQLQEEDEVSTAQYGLVRIRPSDMGKKVIKVLNGSAFNQLQITVTEFFSRSENNDPRLQNIDTQEVFKERRAKDRREFTLISAR